MQQHNVRKLIKDRGILANLRELRYAFQVTDIWRLVFAKEVFDMDLYGSTRSPFGASLLAGLIMTTSPAWSAITIDIAEILAGKLVVTGNRTGTATSITMDGQFNTGVVASGAFSFSLNYLPSDCIVDLKADGGSGGSATAVIANCGPKGLNARGLWLGTRSYAENDVVSDQGSSWRAKQKNSGKQPAANLALWEVLAAKGASGAQGVQGATGPGGAQGLSGPKGDTGDTGAKGDPGADGIQGVMGPAGSFTGSVYHVWVKYDGVVEKKSVPSIVVTKTGTGFYSINFPRLIESCGLSATVTSGNGVGLIRAYPEVDLVTLVSPDVQVDTVTVSGGNLVASDKAFQLVVICTD